MSATDQASPGARVGEAAVTAAAPALTPERVEQRLRERFPDVPFRRQEGAAVRDHTLYLPAGRLVEVCTFLRDDPQCQMTMLSWIGGVDLNGPDGDNGGAKDRRPGVTILISLNRRIQVVRIGEDARLIKVRTPGHPPRRAPLNTIGCS